MQHLFHLQPFWLLVEPYKQQLMRHGHCCWKWFLGEALFLQVTDQITIFVPEEQDSMYIWKGISRIAK